MLDEAKRKAAAANDTAKTTMDRLDAIRKEMSKLNVSSVDSNLTSVMDDVDQTGDPFGRTHISCLKVCGNTSLNMFLFYNS